MTMTEFAPIMAMLESGSGMREAVRAEQAAVYYDLLRHLPEMVARAAAKQALIEHKYPSLPSVGLILSLANELHQPAIPEPIAWSMFLKAVRRYGSGIRRLYAGGKVIETDNSVVGLASLPPQVRRAASAFGWQTMCDTPNEELGFAQEQFRKLYASLEQHDTRQAIMPPEVKAIAASLTYTMPAIEP